MMGSGNILHLVSSQYRDITTDENYRYDNHFFDKVKVADFSVVKNSPTVIEHFEHLLKISQPLVIHLYINDQCDLLVLENNPDKINSSEYIQLANVEFLNDWQGENKRMISLFGKTKNNYEAIISYLESEEGVKCVSWVLSKDKERLLSHYCRLYKLDKKQILAVKLEVALDNKDCVARHKI